MKGVFPGVGQNDGDGADARIAHGVQRRFHGQIIQGDKDAAGGIDSFGNRMDLRVQWGWQIDGPGENIWSGTVADGNGVFQPFRSQQGDRRPFSFQQGVGRNGCPQADFLDGGLGKRARLALPDHPADTLQDRIVVLNRFGQKLVRMDPAFGVQAQHIGKGPAAVHG